MTDNQPRIWQGRFKSALVLEQPDRSLDDQLALMGIEVERIDRALSEDELVEKLAAGQHNLIFKRSRTPITRRVIEASQDLFGIMLCCIGDDSVDKQAAADHGVLVQNDPISNGRSVAELVMGEMICLARRVLDANADTKTNRFAKSNKGRYELLGKTLGVFGMGNIGKQVAQLGTALDMDVCFFDTREVAIEVGVTMGWRPASSLGDLFRRSNVVTTHISADDWRGRSNKNVLNFEHFKEMGANGKGGPRIFLNAARGVLYEPSDLIRAVDEGHIDAAFVDCYPEEPRSNTDPWENPFASCAGVFTTPHIGAATMEAQPRIAAHIGRTTRLLNDTGSLRDCVFKPGRLLGVDPKIGRTILAVVHCDVRGTKKAVDDTIYDAGASNLQSAHRDFPRYSIAYDLNVLDMPLSDDQLYQLVARATELTGEPRAIRSIRQFTVPEPPD